MVCALLVLLPLLAHAAAAGASPRTTPTIAPPTAPPLDELDAWWAPDTVADMTRAVVRVRPVGRGLALDDAVGGVAPVAAGVLLRRGAGGNATSSTPRLVITTWRGATPGFTRYALDWVSGERSAATLLWADPTRPVAVLALDEAIDEGTGVELADERSFAGLQVDDPVATVGLAVDGPDGGAAPASLTPESWSAFTSYVYDRRAHLPRNEGASSGVRGATSLMTRALLARPKLGAGNAVFDVAGRLVGLDIQDDLTAAGLTGWGAEAHALPAGYVADAVLDALLVWEAKHGTGTGTGTTTLAPARGDLGVAWVAIPLGAAVAHHRLPPALALRPVGFDGADGPGSVPRVLKVGAIDAGSPAAGVLRAGDILVAVDGGATLGDDVRAVDAALTSALRAGRNASLVVARGGARRDLSAAPADAVAARPTRALTFGGCTFQDVGIAAARRFQLGATPGALVAACVDPALAPVAAMLARSTDMQAPMLPVLVTKVGGVDVRNLAEFGVAARRAVAAARAAAPSSSRPLPIPFAFVGAHVGNSRGYSMVDAAALARDGAAVVEWDMKGDGSWGHVGGEGGGDDDAAPPATPADVVRRTPGPANRAPAARAPPDDGPLPARRPGSAPGWPTLGSAKGGTVAGVENENGVATAVDNLPPLASRPVLAALAALPRGPPRSLQSSGAWNATTLASFKLSVVSISMQEMWPLENYGAAPSSAGSGFVVDRARGILATNAHVAGAFAGGWEVTFLDGTVLEVGWRREERGGRRTAPTARRLRADRAPPPSPCSRHGPFGTPTPKTSPFSRSTPPACPRPPPPSPWAPGPASAPTRRRAAPTSPPSSRSATPPASSLWRCRARTLGGVIGRTKPLGGRGRGMWLASSRSEAGERGERGQGWRALDHPTTPLSPNHRPSCSRPAAPAAARASTRRAASSARCLPAARRPTPGLRAGCTRPRPSWWRRTMCGTRWTME